MNLFRSLCVWLAFASVLMSGESKRIVFLTGPDSHGYGTHDFAPTAHYLSKCLESACSGVEAEVIETDWFSDPEGCLRADAVLFYCDGLEDHIITEENRAFIDTLAKRGIGIGFLHWACAADKENIGPDMLNWVGGYYETYWSVNPQWEAVFHYMPIHPVTRGVVPFQMYGEWYFNMRMRENAVGMIPVLTAIPPDHARMGQDGPNSGNPHVRSTKGQPEHLAWTVENANGQRGFALTGLHYYWNLGHPGLRRLLLNACLWLAGADVPDAGAPVVPVTLEELEAFNPAIPDDEWISRERKEWAKRFEAWNGQFAVLSGPSAEADDLSALLSRQIESSAYPERILAEAISGKDRTRARLALECVLNGVGGDAIQDWLTSNILSLSPDGQLWGLSVLRRIKARGLNETIVQLSRSGSGYVRCEAVRMLAGLAREEDLPFLVQQLLSSNPDLKVAATVALRTFSADSADSFILGLLRSNDPALQSEAIRLVIEREQRNATEELLRIALQKDNPNNGAAIRASGKVAPVDEATYRRFLQLFIQWGSGSAKRDWQVAILDLSQRQSDSTRAAAVIEACKDGAPEHMQRPLSGLQRKLKSLAK